MHCIDFGKVVGSSDVDFDIHDHGPLDFENSPPLLYIYIFSIMSPKFKKKNCNTCI
jgi:hypothetical protein